MNKSIISEALGVPEGIVKAAMMVYVKIIEELQSTKKNVRGMSIEVSLPKKEQLIVGDHKFNKIELEINFHPMEREEIALASMAVRGGLSFSNLNLLKFDRSEPKTIRMGMELVTGPKFKKSEIINYLIKNKNMLIPILSHELKHGYDMLKRKFYTTKEHSLYLSKTGTFFGIEPIDKFIMDLYYTSNIENLVRPSEVAASLELEGISKKDFINYLLSNEVYNRLKQINSFDFDKMKKDVYNYLPRVYEIINNEGWDVKDDDQAVDLILRAVMITLGMKSLNIFVDVMSAKSEEKIFQIFAPEKQKIMDKFYREVTKFGEDHEAFFKYEQKKMKEVSTKMMKKIAKLYDYIKDEKPTDEKSIKDWNLHHKINAPKNEEYYIEMKTLKEYLKAI
jgi:hypothetical protein